MSWADLIPIIAKYGLELGQYLFTLWSQKSPPTQADWDKLNALRGDNARSQLLLAFARNGIDINSDQAKALLAMLPA
jgi:hypothetical protein